MRMAATLGRRVPLLVPCDVSLLGGVPACVWGQGSGVLRRSQSRALSSRVFSPRNMDLWARSGGGGHDVSTSLQKCRKGWSKRCSQPPFPTTDESYGKTATGLLSPTGPAASLYPYTNLRGDSTCLWLKHYPAKAPRSLGIATSVLSPPNQISRLRPGATNRPTDRTQRRMRCFKVFSYRRCPP
ncbi:hypothetical protein LY76DRAFT_118598 [Colletotrichum caudatum]|nr:hypothetical protein LY76DRAFT_118598 [Colletotrichum caudatum]